MATLWSSNVAIENGPFIESIVDLPIKDCDFYGYLSLPKAISGYPKNARPSPWVALEEDL